MKFIANPFTIIDKKNPREYRGFPDFSLINSLLFMDFRRGKPGRDKVRAQVSTEVGPSRMEYGLFRRAF